MSYIVVDVEADGEYPGDYSMVCFGACIVESSLSKTFYGQVPPVSKKWNKDALAVSGFSREEHLKFGRFGGTAPNTEISEVMTKFSNWVKTNSKGKPIFISDNLAFDWMWINYYLHKYAKENPFGWSGRRIGDLWAGYQNDMFVKWKWMRKTNHDHNPVNDAIGNAEALLEFKRKGLKINLI